MLIVTEEVDLVYLRQTYLITPDDLLRLAREFVCEHQGISSLPASSWVGHFASTCGFEQLYQVLDNELQRTQPRTPQINGMVERFYASFCGILYMIVQDLTLTYPNPWH